MSYKNEVTKRNKNSTSKQKFQFQFFFSKRLLGDALEMAHQSKDVLGINMVLSKCDPISQKVIIERAKTLRAELMSNQK
jgi:hypothetical protein